MTSEKMLRRVEADVAAGDLGLARLRLQSALAQCEDAAVRSALVRVCRLSGDPAAAGRHGFLTDDVTEAEVAAFAARYGGVPARMLRALPGYGRSDLPATASARVRELQRRRDAELDPDNQGRRQQRWTDTVSDVGPDIGFGIAALVLVVLVVLGLVQAGQLVLRLF